MKRLLASIIMGLVCMPGCLEAVATESEPSACLPCHRERNAGLVADWEKSRHNLPDLDCRSCHGTKHDGTMAAQARRNDACTACHARESSSYTLSKHGVLATLEAGRMDFTQPLRDGNFRAPTCAYCHLHRGNHNIGAEVFPLLPREECQISSDNASRTEARALPCRDCHSPRLVETWFLSGDRMLEIGRMKVREAMTVVKQIATLDTDLVKQAQSIQKCMTDEHLRNVRLGVGHQSPDDQWWHGHPALDGDLLRIKSILSKHPVKSTEPCRRD
ncbi:multiheme c-type cytochrome [Candidatus Magnetaquicoccus inordinatus]|uniref:multiheme c-type cytochrome n=1 Tax=Candidatus Magnetaquicoccus inordinatus TaxID=2496818 RepID=UPI00102C0071|nr:multiheme c-type cytochrome [Candidatus Magnetaquicoccus inordinatus]